MNGQLRPRVNYVIGPDGSPLTIADLPPPGSHRWVIRRKAEVVAAVRGGLLSLEEACQRYTLTVEEYLGWQRSIDKQPQPIQSSSVSRSFFSCEMRWSRSARQERDRRDQSARSGVRPAGKAASAPAMSASEMPTR